MGLVAAALMLLLRLSQTPVSEYFFLDYFEFFSFLKNITGNSEVGSIFLEDIMEATFLILNFRALSKETIFPSISPFKIH